MADYSKSSSISSGLLSSPTLPVLLAIGLIVLLRYFSRTDTPKIKGLPEVPGLPIVGNLHQLGENHAKVAREWSKKYGPVFQVKLGNRRVVFANTFDSVRELWITNQSALISRPTLHTFHTVVSSSEGFTIGTSPWDESCKARRKAAATALNRPAVQSYMPIIDYESTKSIKEILTDSKHGELDVDISLYFARYALSTSLTLNYGLKIEGNIDDKLLNEITHVEREISYFRSTSNNWADYIPLLRLLPGSNTRALEYKERRAVYMHRLLDMLKARIAQGTDKPCITGNVLKDPEAKLNEGLSMVSAGLDTVPGNLVMGVAYLSSPRGQELQERALEEIRRQYPDGDAWERCLHEEKVTYITAMVKEILRFWSVIPICLPRVNVKPIQWGDAVIPPGTSFYMNAYAAHYDDDHFKSPFDFNPDRYLADNSVDDAAASRGTPHYGYGAGSRMCIGSHLANRELYTALLRLITAFQILPPKSAADAPILDALACNRVPTSLTLDPKPFKLGFRVRDETLLARWIAESERRTCDL
ncbi:hypothetical protein AMS68_007749 [Peltaster fructicola]|uniref:Phenylacetate 2-hydroxylase n=1 Tax=Peltaster fructicola TaxID=286661 RepID=A0A6H0Y5B8_9PEZI|nr:hypothetical protein AMS68_007749 [Peltaster fructicola]